ncbi:hypothetical protein V1264_008849 [Littorina saxatilis]|uniref:Uncharacterized protein n=1 Tax=Littorina saxatilis TaxID=31220 RepID=A0AAN9AQ47_9CAEN
MSFGTQKTRNTRLNTTKNNPHYSLTPAPTKNTSGNYGNNTYPSGGRGGGGGGGSTYTSGDRGGGGGSTYNSAARGSVGGGGREGGGRGGGTTYNSGDGGGGGGRGGGMTTYTTKPYMSGGTRGGGGGGNITNRSYGGGEEGGRGGGGYPAKSSMRGVSKPSRAISRSRYGGRASGDRVMFADPGSYETETEGKSNMSPVKQATLIHYHAAIEDNVDIDLIWEDMQDVFDSQEQDEIRNAGHKKAEIRRTV